MSVSYISLFSGIGAFEKALSNLGIKTDLVAYSEIDKYAPISYEAVHGIPQSKNLGDITKVDETKLPKVDLVTYGFPCQDISLAGKQRGLFDENGNKTRSGLFFDALRVIEATKPRIAIAENVKNLTSAKFESQFKIVLDSLDEAGYNNYWKVLNSRDFGIPQNRERVFIVSIRKDVDDGMFEFPQPVGLTRRLKDMLEDKVDEKYFLSDKMLAKLTFNKTASASSCGIIKVADTHIGGQKSDVISPEGVSSALTATDYKQPKQICLEQVAQMYPDSGNPQAGRIYNAEGLSPALDTCSGGNRMPKVASVPVCLNSKGGRNGVPGLQPSVQDRVYDSNGVSTAVTTCYMPSFTDNLRIRKLTPRECWRLMGFDDADCDRAAARGISNTQLYKQAGNSIVVDVAEAIFSQLEYCGLLEN